MREYSDSELLTLLRSILIKNGGDLSAGKLRQIAKEQNIPGDGTYCNRFGGWNVAKQRAILEGELEDTGTTEFEEEVLSHLHSSISLEDLCNKIDRSPASVKEAVAGLRSKGYSVSVDETKGGTCSILKEPFPYKKVTIESFYDGKVKIGLLGDTQLGSESERLDIMNTLYDLYEKEGITKVYHAGDFLDGDGVYRGQYYELHTVGADKQVRYAIENYPKREGITTYFITGNHDLVYFKRTGYDIGNGSLTKERKDLVYLGPEEADVHLYAEGEEEGTDPASLRLFHPGGTGSSYALSYRAQKTIESYGGGEKPSILAMGHFHKASYFFVRNVHTIQVGCCQSQTRFMRNRAIQAHTGGFILEFNVEPNGSINRFKNEFIPFYGD